MNEIKVIYEPPEETEIIEIVYAAYVSDYCIRLWFDDDTIRVVDFGPFLRQVQNPVLKQYLDVSKFEKFNLLDGNLDWNDYEMCFPVADLYEGTILKYPPAEQFQPDRVREGVR